MKTICDITIRQYIATLLLAVFHHVRSNSHCVGTCYSGKLFPEPKDIFHGKHLKGFSYNNITTDDPVKCYSSCVQDCRCKACQMKDARCELLDEDKTSKGDDFKAESGYVYFDLKQTMYKGKQSHMVPPGVCYNGCCRSQPCMNGGTCEELCQTTKEKFTCICQKKYKGKTCEDQIQPSCMDIMIASKTTPKNGVYSIRRKDNGNIFPVYCAFERDRSWTLMESSSLEKNTFKKKPFSLDYKMNADNPQSWDSYRLSLGSMLYLRSNSTLFRATCDFPNRVSLTPDLLIGRLSDVDITAIRNLDECRRYEFIDIMGHTCRDCTANTANGYKKSWHVHVDVTWKKCDFGHKIKVPDDIIKNTDNFGYYGVHDQRFKCTANLHSTTQWWLGEEK